MRTSMPCSEWATATTGSVSGRALCCCCCCENCSVLHQLSGEAEEATAAAASSTLVSRAPSILNPRRRWLNWCQQKRWHVINLLSYRVSCTAKSHHRDVIAWCMDAFHTTIMEKAVLITLWQCDVILGFKGAAELVVVKIQRAEESLSFDAGIFITFTYILGDRISSCGHKNSLKASCV